MTVVLMAFNEAQSLASTVREIAAELSALGEHCEIVIVDDGSTDGTGGVADRLAAELPDVRVVHHPENRGLGGVYRTGFSEARGRLVTFFPADGQFPASIITRFHALVHDQDIVFGYLPRRERALLGRLLSLVERVLYRAIFGPMPRFQGILMFRRELLGRYELRSTGRGWAVLMEFILRCARDRVRCVSVPTDVRPRQHGYSKVNNVRTIVSNFRQMLTLREVLR